MEINALKGFNRIPKYPILYYNYFIITLLLDQFILYDTQ